MRKKRKNVQFRRKNEGKTDYNKRIKLLSSQKARVVVRVSNNNIIVQLVDFDSKGDKVIAAEQSKNLKKQGWNAGPTNIPAAYLTGLLLSKKIKEGTEAILDMGLQKATKGSKVFAVVKGLIDAGVNINCSPKIMPSDERISGKHIADYAKSLKEKKDEDYKKRFSEYIKQGVDPEKLPELFEKTKQNIISK